MKKLTKVARVTIYFRLASLLKEGPFFGLSWRRGGAQSKWNRPACLYVPKNWGRAVTISPSFTTRKWCLTLVLIFLAKTPLPTRGEPNLAHDTKRRKVCVIIMTHNHHGGKKVGKTDASSLIKRQIERGGGGREEMEAVRSQGAQQETSVTFQFDSFINMSNLWINRHKHNASTSSTLLQVLCFEARCTLKTFKVFSRGVLDWGSDCRLPTANCQFSGRTLNLNTRKATTHRFLSESLQLFAPDSFARAS